MGVCESSLKNYGSKSTQDEDSLHETKEQKKIISLLKKNDGFLLPKNITKRDDINKYYIIKHKVLGKGAYSLVYEGDKNGTKYAIKRMNKNKIILSNILILEAEISFQLKHENIINYYELYEDSQYINYVMEKAEFGDLFSFIVNCPLHHLPSNVVIDLLIQIFNVIDYLHSVKGIVHRDIKPQNFLIKLDNQKKPIIKLIDFGFSTYIPKGNEKLKEVIGTTEYAAPEILEEKEYGEKVDEWAIGIMIFNMLTGLEPFQGDTQSEMKNSVLNDQIPFEQIDDVDLRELCKKLLNRSEEKRISCKEALAEVIKIKNERNNYFRGMKRLNKKTPSFVLRKGKKEEQDYSKYLNELIEKNKM